MSSEFLAQSTDDIVKKAKEIPPTERKNSLLLFARTLTERGGKTSQIKANALAAIIHMPKQDVGTTQINIAVDEVEKMLADTGNPRAAEALLSMIRTPRLLGRDRLHRVFWTVKRFTEFYSTRSGLLREIQTDIQGIEQFQADLLKAINEEEKERVSSFIKQSYELARPWPWPELHDRSENIFQEIWDAHMRTQSIWAPRFAEFLFSFVTALYLFGKYNAASMSFFPVLTLSLFILMPFRFTVRQHAKLLWGES